MLDNLVLNYIPLKWMNIISPNVVKLTTIDPTGFMKFIEMTRFLHFFSFEVP